jgi:diguanylate cyclase (GGDEF)-like protein
MQNHVIQINVALGIILLVSGIPPLWRICNMLPRGLIRAMWFTLGLLISVAVLGYLSFFYLTATEGPNHPGDLLISSIFLVAAVFAAVICRMAYTTAKDVSRIALLEHHARVDSLTELFNRRYTMSLLQTACRSSAVTLSVLLLDIDEFKGINDTFGHQAGDNVLQRFASLLTSLHSSPSFVGRYGGDEFLVVLPHADSAGACAVADRIRQGAEAIDFGDQSRPITVSIGVATCSGSPTIEADDLLAQADEALYRAKRGGRNRVVESRAGAQRAVFTYPSVAEDPNSPLQLAD